MTHALPRYLATLAIAFLACTTPTSICACPPLRTAVYALGTVTDAAGAPVQGATVVFQDVTRGYPPHSLSLENRGDTRTDAAGAFRGTVYSFSDTGVREVRAVVAPAGAADTVWRSIGPVTFRRTSESLDTVRIALSLP